MGFRIRRTTARDLMAVDEVLQRSYPALLRADYPPSVLVTAVPLIARARPGLLASRNYYLVETDAGRVIGCGGWSRRGPMGQARPGTGHIRHFATHPDFLRLGVGRALMERCFLAATRSGLSGFECFSTRTAVPFYRSFGFQELGEISLELRPGISFPAIHMEVVLAS